ncbi:hypothetical protein [Clostridium butyricum]|uniref:Phage portal protein n=1 Tax=Clostridium butyricum TaxID=1492 RepID=A0A6N3FHK8_CLOBU
MVNFNERDVLKNKFFTLWFNNEEKATVLTAKATSSLKTQKIPIAGQLGEPSIPIGSEGTGSLSFYKIIDDTLNKDINDCIKAGQPFKFDLIGELENKDTGGSYRVIIENCQITSFEVLNIDITSTDVVKQSYDFEYNPDDVTVE